MFGPSGGWGIPIAPPTLMITVGGITTKSRIHQRRSAASGDARCDYPSTMTLVDGGSVRSPAG
jgi:hypothetical protein